MSRLIFMFALAAGFLAPAAQVSDVQRARVAWVPNPRTANASWVSDPSHHLRPATIAEINGIIGALERETTAEIGVAVVDSTSGLEAQEFATALHRVWGVGKAGRNNGVLLLWDPVHRAVFISTGQGLEGAIPDRRAGRIRDEIIAEFRQSHFDEGMLAGVRALAAAAREETSPRPVLTPAEREAALASHRAPGVRAGRDGGGMPWWPIGGGLGGLGALIGGLFGYRRWKRYRPRSCSNGHTMRLLSEREEDDKLDQGAQAEERVKSIDWDVWYCGQCQEVLRIPWKKWMSGYSECPRCKRLTAHQYTKTITAATTLHGGTEQVINHCGNCGWKTESTRSTPRIVESSSSSGGSSHSGGGGSSGGGGGGSFGGGSAGGGGAGGHY